MPANRKAPESAPFWFQSNRSPAWRLYALGCSYKVSRVARMAAYYMADGR
ncbi:hypothetical protein ACFL1V_05250 [Pseudomonadota bacterium]